MPKPGVGGAALAAGFVAATVTVPSMARAELPYVLQPSVDIGFTSMTDTLSFGEDMHASGYGLHLVEWNGFITKAFAMLTVGAIINVGIKRADVEWSRNEWTYTSDVAVTTTGGGRGLARQTVVQRETTFKVTPRPPEEIAAAEGARDEALGNMSILPMHTDILFLPERDDGSLRGIRGVFYMFAYPVTGWLEVASGVYGARLKADVLDPATGTTTLRRHRAAGIPLRITLAPLTWAQLTFEGYGNLAGLDAEDDGIDRSSTVRGTFTLAIPYFERAYGRIGAERNRVLEKGRWGTFFEVGVRF